ncbi:MAG TPA: winged helix DNA-binding domain-containing protein [Solirubrobacteraceae bacterium]|nr:winged helix DNA-binding domain-containing protein [Solirubrobacteraceae bacterium]
MEPVAQRLVSQLLAGERANDPVHVARRLLAVQAQDPRGMRLAIRARSHALSASDVDRALSHDRSLVVTWLNRGTLHLVASEDYAWLHALTTPPLFTASARRLAQERVTPAAAERGVSTIARALERDGPLDRAQLRERLDAAGVRTQGQALVHLLLLASLRALIVRGPVHGSSHAYVLTRDWLGEQPRVERQRALAELARRYLRGHAPADDRDLARWSGLPLRDARAGLHAIAGELLQREDGLLALARTSPPAPRERRPRRAASPRTREPPPPAAPPLLLGAFDPLLLGWRSREQLLGADARIVTTNGIFRPFALVRERAVATWTLSRARVELRPFARIAPADERALRADGEDVLRFLRRD